MAFVCEMCGDDNVVKQGGVFVCQGCGTKYSPEDVKQSMKQVVVDVSGSTVKVDSTERLSNLYALARRAMEGRAFADAKAYYKAILLEEPESWEATLYSIYLEADNRKIMKTNDLAVRITNDTEFILCKIQEQEPFEMWMTCIQKVLRCCDYLSGIAISDAAEWHGQPVSDSTPIDVLAQRTEFYRTCILNGVNIMYHLGDCIEAVFGEIDPQATMAWKIGNERMKENAFRFDGEYKDYIRGLVEHYSEEIRKYDPSYEMPEVKTAWCYVATCVYGSYDCPQVWTLRRFRDNTLAKSLPGRGFIRLYYAISPTIVRWFGHTSWFQKLWRSILNRMVRRLNERGVESTPYQDSKW